MTKNKVRKKVNKQEQKAKQNKNRDKLYKVTYFEYLKRDLKDLQAFAKRIIDKEEKLSAIRQVALRNAILKKTYEYILENREKQDLKDDNKGVE